jgi:transcription elongation factor Elf1
MICKPEEHYICPVCGQEVFEAVYVSNDGDVIGCDNCAQIKEPWEMLEDETDYE